VPRASCTRAPQARRPEEVAFATVGHRIWRYSGRCRSRRSLDAKARWASIDSTPRVQRYGCYPTRRVVSRHVTAARMGTAAEERCTTNKLGGAGGPATSAGISSPSWAGGRCGRRRLRSKSHSRDRTFINGGRPVVGGRLQRVLLRVADVAPDPEATMRPAWSFSSKRITAPSFLASVCTLLARADASRAHCTRYTLKSGCRIARSCYGCSLSNRTVASLFSSSRASVPTTCPPTLDDVTAQGNTAEHAPDRPSQAPSFRTNLLVQ
jgi:hypothetical protein